MGESQITIKAIFIAWEKLRVVYVGLLIVLVFGLLLFLPRDWDPQRPPPWAGPVPGTLNWPRAFASCAVEAVLVNFCFFLGPMVESYAVWLGLNRGTQQMTLRWTLFVLGTLFTAAAAAVQVIIATGA